MHYRGLHSAAKGWLIAELQRTKHRKLLLVTHDRSTAETLVEDIKFFTGSDRVLHYPAWDTLPFEPVSPQTHIMAQRLLTLWKLQSLSQYICVISADALMQRVLPQEFLLQTAQTLTQGKELSRETLYRDLHGMGFSDVSLVEEVGEIAQRGLVLDIFSATNEFPCRIEFHNNRIEKIKRFDADSQRTIDEISTLTITPVREHMDLAADWKFAQYLEEALMRVKKVGKELDVPPREIVKLLTALKSKTELPGIEGAMAIALPALDTVFSYFPQNLHLLLDNRTGITQAADEFTELLEERHQRLKAEHYLVPEIEQQYLSPEIFKQQLARYPHDLLDDISLTKDIDIAPKEKRYTCNSLIELSTKLKTKVGTGQAFAPLIEYLNKVRKKNYLVAFAVGSPVRAERLQRILLDLDLDAKVLEGTAEDWLNASNPYPVVIIHGYLSAGAELVDQKLVFIAEHEIFNERSYRQSRRSKTSLKKLLSSLSQLKEDDYIVHADYGIGIYRGLTHKDIESSESDFLHIEYADSKLFLPVHNIGKIQKFVATEGQTPALDKLGSTRWIRTKEKIKQSVLPLAGDLIKLYAERSVAKGWRFEPFGSEDERFADEFAYNETPDQLKAISETIENMASDRPMDRLICGDVGFGKTEVALRAAFKCVQHTRQVVLLVPTTLLAEQHYKTFQARFRGYPIKVGITSRFYPAEENKKTLAGLASGEIDIIIGTHKLLQRDVAFKDLGLLIIDEEHRFGVKQKELLKRFRKDVDVLTLTATPIPRTLHMSLLGIRDVSIISTPPTDRRFTRTYTATYDDTLVRDAILRELQRSGQCFYVHNRIDSIALLTATLRELIPEARFEFAHGQMSETQLENIMHRYINHEIDVLVTTTIIESGIDIPNANTIIIDRADMYGLAQLYQLRGRVGRSDRQAYCYFIIPKRTKLSADAQQRLKALQSLDDLGLGFNLAMRDLEIRGAGNLLGKEQSGNVLAIGFELYCKILKEAVLHLKGEELSLEETVDPEVKFPFNAFIPEWYIPDISERLVLYQRLAAAQSTEEIDELTNEIQDRFSNPPREMYEFTELMRLRSVLRAYGVVKAECIKEERILLSFSPKARIELDRVMSLVKRQPEKYRFGKNLTFSMALSEPISDPANLYWSIRSLLESIAQQR